MYTPEKFMSVEGRGHATYGRAREELNGGVSLALDLLYFGHEKDIEKINVDEYQKTNPGWSSARGTTTFSREYGLGYIKRQSKIHKQDTGGR